MIALDAATVFVLLPAAALAGALASVLPQWRRLVSGDLPIHKHLAHEAPPFDALVRCALCAGSRTCARRSSPLPECPNAGLFSRAASRTTAAPPA